MRFVASKSVAAPRPRMRIVAAHPGTLPLLAFSCQESVHGQVRALLPGRKEHHGRSTRDGDRAFAQAEDKSTKGTLPGAVWRGITLFEWRAPVSADCLALAGEGSGRSE